MKKISKIILAVLLCSVLGLSPAWSELADFPNALGVFGGGILSGSGSGFGGLHYQHWFSKVGVQVEGGIMYTPSSEGLNYSLAVDGLFPVYSSDFSDKLGGRVYIFGSVGHNGSTYQVSPVYNDDYTIILTEGYSVFHPSILVAAGIGIEIVLFQHFSIPVHFGYAADIPVNTAVGNDLNIGFTLSGGVRYRF